MKRLGTVTGTAQGLVIARAESEDRPDIGTRALDDQLDAVGRVVDVFGPVEQPYLAIASERDRIATLVGDVVYARPS